MEIGLKHYNYQHALMELTSIKYFELEGTLETT